VKDNIHRATFSNAVDFHSYIFGYLRRRVAYNKRFYQKNKARISKMPMRATMEKNFLKIGGYT